MSKYTAPEPSKDPKYPTATGYHDSEVEGTSLWVSDEGNGDMLFDCHDSETSSDTTFVLSARDRATLALQVLDGVPGIKQGTPVKNRAKYQIIVDTHTVYGNPTEDGIDRLLQRLAWHLRNGIPGKIAEPEGGVFTINEVSEGEVPPRMSETRRHFRYHLPTDPGGDWHYHHNFRKIQSEGGVDVQFQRTFKSEWEDA